MKRKAVIILLVLVFALALALACACGSGGCYSTYPGCEATAEFIATVAAEGGNVW